MKKTKRVLALVLTVLMLLSVAPVTAFAATEYEGYFYYTVQSDGTAKITGIRYSDTKIEIPEKIGGRKVSSIKDEAFYGSQVKEVTISDTLNNITSDTFRYSNIESVVAKASNPYYSSKDGVLFSKDGTHLVAYPEEKSGEVYSVSNGVKCVDESAFAYNFNLKKVILPSGLTKLEDAAFYACINLEAVELPNTLTTMGQYVFTDCQKLDTLKIPASLKNIAEYASVSSGVKTVIFEEGFERVAPYMFRECENLTTVVIPKSLKTISTQGFIFTNIKDVYYTGTWQQWRNLVNTTDCSDFNGAEIHEDFDGTLASGYCGESTHWSLSIDGTLTLSGTGIVKNYNNAAIVPWNKYASQIKKVVVGNGITRIGEFAFYGCTNLMSVSLPSSLKEINGYVFKNCSSLTQITLPSSLTKIGDSAFYGTGLTSVKIPASVKSVGYYAFSRCYSLKNIEFLGNAPTFYSNAFNKVEATVTYPANNSSWTSAKKQPYGGTLKWVQKGLIDEGLCGSTTSWKLSSGGTLTISGTGVVKNYQSAGLVPWNKYASQIKKVVVENGVTRIGEFAFYGCYNLTSVALPSSLKEINGYVFKRCSSLVNITLPGGLTKIGDSAFYGSGLDKITLPSSVNSIGYYAFAHCYDLDTIVFSGNAPYFYSNAFKAVEANAYYPANNSTWTASKMQQYGGVLNWSEQIGEFELEVLRLVNIERAKEGLAPLSWNKHLASGAAIRADEIQVLFDHTRPNGESCFTVIDMRANGFYTAGENIAAGYRTPAEVVNGWMNSPGHRANILNPDFKYLGVGFENYHWVQLFAG